MKRYNKASPLYLIPKKIAGFIGNLNFSADDGQAMFGHQVGVWHHVGAAIVVVWHCMGV